MFADVALALRIDSAEARLARAMALAPPATPSGPGAIVLPTGAGFAVFARPGSPINKVMGLGLEATITDDALATIEEAFRARGEEIRVELSTLASADAGERLTGRGYRLRGFENVLGLDLRVPLPEVDRSSRVVVERSAANALQPWFDVLVDGFMAPDDTGVPSEPFPRAILEEVTHDFARLPDLQRYVAHVDGAPAGAASMRFDAGIALLCGAATSPSFRRRGVQQALFRQRMADAASAGCDLAVVTTAPGTTSQANAERRGFRLLYTRAVLVLPA